MVGQVGRRASRRRRASLWEWRHTHAERRGAARLEFFLRLRKHVIPELDDGRAAFVNKFV
jgi:hypothetical protein